MQTQKPKIMGVINLTKDSFYPNSRHDIQSSILQAKQMLSDGADILDIGAESTRPGASKIPASAQTLLLIPVITAIREFYHGTLSIDTSETEVMLAGIAAGADMINDVRALSAPGALAATANSGVKVCLNHIQKQPESNDEIISTLSRWCETTLETCIKSGIKFNNIILDPGFGFGKTLTNNWHILSKLELLTKDYNIAIGVSNKSMFAPVTGGQDVNNRRIPSCIAEAIATIKQVKIVRTHDIKTTRQAIDTARLLIGEAECLAPME